MARAENEVYFIGMIRECEEGKTASDAGYNRKVPNTGGIWMKEGLLVPCLSCCSLVLHNALPFVLPFAVRTLANYETKKSGLRTAMLTPTMMTGNGMQTETPLSSLVYHGPTAAFEGSKTEIEGDFLPRASTSFTTPAFVFIFSNLK